MPNHQLKLFILSCLAFVIGGLAGGALGVAWIHIQAQFNLPLSSLGILVGVTTVGRLTTSSASGPLINRFGIAWVLIAGMFVSTIGSLGYVIAPSWEMLIFAAFVMGVGTGVLSTGLNSYAAVNFSTSQMNWLHASFGLGSTIGPMIVTVIVIDFGLMWQWSYAFLTLIRFVILVLFVATRNDWRTIHDDRQPEAPSSAGIRDTMRLPIVWMLILIFLVGVGLEATTGQLANNLLVNGRSIDPKVAGTWVSIYWGSLTVSRILVGFVVERVSNGVFLRLNMLGIIIGTGLLWSNLSPVTSFLGLAIIGFTIAPFAPLMTSDTPIRVGHSHTANLIGFQFTGAGIGMALLPWLAGVLGETFGLESIPPFLFTAAILMFLLHELILRRDAHNRHTPPLTVLIAPHKK